MDEAVALARDGRGPPDHEATPAGWEFRQDSASGKLLITQPCVGLAVSGVVSSSGGDIAMVSAMRRIGDDFASLLKDSLRGVRYAVRHGTRLGQDAVAFAPGAPGVARLADTLLAATERTAASLLRRAPAFEPPGTLLEMFAALSEEGDATRGRRLFVQLHYRLIQVVLLRLGVDNVFISEQEIAIGYRGLRRRHSRILTALRPARAPDDAAVLRFWIAAAVTLAVRQPLRGLDLPRAAGPRTALLEQAPAPYCLLIVALTGAILTTRQSGAITSAAGRVGEASLPTYIDSAIAVATARFEQLAPLFVQRDGVERLSAALRPVLPLLP